MLIIRMASQSGIYVILVTKPSRKPAMIKNGTVLITIFKPSLIPMVKDFNLVNVPGNNMLLPTTKPAAPATIITEISMVPCIHIVLADSHSNPCS